MTPEEARQVLKQSQQHSPTQIARAMEVLMKPAASATGSTAASAASTASSSAREHPASQGGPAGLPSEPADGKRPRRPHRTQPWLGLAIGLLLPLVFQYFSSRLPSNTLSVVDRLWDKQLFFCIFVVVTLLLLWLAAGFFRRNGHHLLTPLLVAFIAVPLMTVSGVVLYQVHASISEQRESLVDLFSEQLWIAYDPRDFDPHAGQFPTEASIRRDLTILKEQGGFTGIITFGNSGTLGEIPYIANELGLRVIMGLWIPDHADVKPVDEFEKARAAAAANVVDAFCVGHVRGESMDYEVVAQWMAELREETSLPVTHTAPMVNYVGERGRVLREIGDWYFPDVGGAWRVHANPSEALRRTREDCFRAAELPSDKPVLLKMLSFPSGPASSGFTPESQREYFLRLLRDMSYPRHVFPSFAFGFDRPFVGRRAGVRPDERDPAGEFVGMFTNEPQPQAKPVVADLLRHWQIPMPPVTVPSGDYLVTREVDPQTENQEHRLFVHLGDERLHFATLLETPAGSLALRPRLDGPADHRWGPTLFLAPFIGVRDADSVGLESLDVSANEDGISLLASGRVSAGDHDGGQWKLALTIGYRANDQRMIVTAECDVRLNDLLPDLPGDVTLLRVNSNHLRKVLLDNGTTGDTGDTRGVYWSNGAGASYDRSFHPSLAQPATYPQDRFETLEVLMRGNVNRAAGDGPESARTPNLRLRLQSKDRALLSFGAQWNASPEFNRFDQGNFAVTPLVLRNGAPARRHLRVEYSLEATPPVVDR